MRTSEVLTKLAAEPGERLSVAAIFANLGDRAFGLSIVILGLPAAVPMPPPIPLICAALLLALAVQMIFGRKTPWAPRALLAKSVAQSDVRRVAARVVPLVQRLERWTRPRLQWGSVSLATRCRRA